MIRGVRAYDLTTHVNPPVRADPGVPLGGDAARTPDRNWPGSSIGGRAFFTDDKSVQPSHHPFAGTADCGSGGRWFESTQLYQRNQEIRGCSRQPSALTASYGKQSVSGYRISTP
jgi:hypothetical protein